MSINYARQSKSIRYGKLEARTAVIDEIFKIKWPHKTIRLLTLPGAWWHFERQVGVIPKHSRFSHFSLTCCERDRIVFNNAALRLPRGKRGIKIGWMKELNNAKVVTNRNDIVLINCNIADFMAITERKYDVVWLDFCGPIHDNVMDSIATTKRVVRTPGLLAITFMKGRETPFYTDLIHQNPNGRAGMITNQIKEMVNPEIEQVYISEYKDTTEMIHMIFKINPYKEINSYVPRNRL